MFGCLQCKEVKSTSTENLLSLFDSTEWLRTDPRRTAVGLDLDLEALQWCLENNINKVGADGYFRISLFHGNVFKPREAKLVSFKPQELIRNIQLEERDDNSKIAAIEPSMHESSTALSNEESIKADSKIPASDIVCAFNYSCCCLHKRVELVLYFKHVLEALSKKGNWYICDEFIWWYIIGTVLKTSKEISQFYGIIFLPIQSR
ncbi:hypothetical protein CRYUN_Cryun02cG0171000 [Craigia yunnanensis]